MTNPTDAGGENPTIRDVSPPSDTQAATVVTHPGSRLLFRSGRLGHVHSRRDARRRVGERRRRLGTDYRHTQRLNSPAVAGRQGSVG